MKSWKRSLLGFVAIAIIAHFAFHIGSPYLIMSRAMNGIAQRAGGFNTPLSTNLPNAASRGIVKPSPDLLYTACAFDIGEGPVLVGGTPSQAYWSMAFYASNTDNFFVINDRQAQGSPAFVVIAAARMRDRIPAEQKSLEVVEPPSDKGIVLFRYLVLDPQDLAKALAAQTMAVCRRL
jgi:uncharacterized membrane protein